MSADPAAAFFDLDEQGLTTGSVGFSEDGRWLSTLGYNRQRGNFRYAHVRDLHGKNPSAASVEFVAKGHDLRTLEISPDGKWAVGLNSGVQVQVWRIPPATAQDEPRTIDGSGFAISRKGKWLAIPGGYEILL